MLWLANHNAWNEKHAILVEHIVSNMFGLGLALHMKSLALGPMAAFVLGLASLVLGLVVTGLVISRPTTLATWYQVVSAVYTIVLN